MTTETVVPVRYVGAEQADPRYHDGRLRPVVGAQSYQVLRANRGNPEWAEEWGWTYNHAPMLAHWRRRFYLEYLSNPWGEHLPPGHTLLTTSPDGRHWARPQVIFPVYTIPDGVYDSRGKPRLARGSQAVMHQRMGFYVAPNDRLLVLGFYGICTNPHDPPNDGTGIGRVVREIYPDDQLGPIYFIRYNCHAGWNETNTAYPYYAASADAGFVEACEALLADRLATLQWWEEDRSPDGFYAVEGYKALSYYHLPDGRVVGLWKFSKAALSEDEGRTWSPVVDVPSLVMAGAKVWGQRTSDGRYAIVYNPNPDNMHRWPLAVVTGGDGQTFDRMGLVNGEVPPRRYPGLYKDFGQNYVRGIAEGNGAPPDGALWVAYSMNKEDIWVSRVPVPVRYEAETPVDDTFDAMEPGGEVAHWNLYSPLWAPVAVEEGPDGGTRCLVLRDRDPYDYARAERLFPASARVEVRLTLMAGQRDHGELHVEIADGKGTPAMSLVWQAGGSLCIVDAAGAQETGAYEPGVWYNFSVQVDTIRQSYRLLRDEAVLARGALAGEGVSAVERVVFRTGPHRVEPTLDTDRHAGELPEHTDEPVDEAAFYIRRLATIHQGA